MQFDHLLDTPNNCFATQCGKRKPLKPLVQFLRGCHHTKKCSVCIQFHALKASAESCKKSTIVIIQYLAGKIALIPQILDRFLICWWMTEYLGGEHSIA